MINAEKLVVDSIDMATLFGISTGELLFMLDQIKDGSIENGSEVVYGTGKNGVRLAALDRNKASRFSCNNGYIVGGALLAQIGGSAVKATEEAPLLVPDYEIINMAAKATSATLSYVPVGVEGAEVKEVWTLRNGAQDRKLTVGTATGTGVFTVDAENKKLTFGADEFTADTEIIIFYDRYAVTGVKYENSQDEFSKSGRLVLDVTCRDVCDPDVIYHTKFVFPNAKIDGNFTITFGNEPAVHALSAEALSSVCSSSKRLWEWYIVE